MSWLVAPSDVMIFSCNATLLMMHCWTTVCTGCSDVSVLVLQPIGADVPGVLVNISRSAAGASPAARHLLQDLSDDGVNLTISITAPASQLHNISDLVQGVVGSAPVRRQLQEAGENGLLASVLVLLTLSHCDLLQYAYIMLLFCFAEPGSSKQ